MGIIKDKYLVVNAKNVSKKIYESILINYGPDGMKFHEESGKERLSKFFGEHGIPEEYQKVYLRLHRFLFSGTLVEEPLTGFLFDYKKRTVGPIKNLINRISPAFDTNEMSGNGIILHSYPIFYGDGYDYNKYTLMSELRNVGYYDYINSIKSLHREGLFYEYCKALNEFFERKNSIGLSSMSNDDLDATLKVCAASAAYEKNPVKNIESVKRIG